MVIAKAGTVANGATPAEVPSGREPWLRWSAGGRVFAEGAADKGFDHVVWTIPEKDGAYTIRLDFYPGEPAEGSYDVASPWFQSLTFIAKARPSGLPDDLFARVDRYQALFEFSGNLEDSGMRVQAQRPLVSGEPRLVPYSGGFGYRLGPDALLRAPRLGFDAVEDEGRFSVALRASLESAGGSLFSLTGRSPGQVLRLVLAEGALVLQTPGDATPVSTALGRGLSAGSHDLVLSFRPGSEGESVATLSVDDDPRLSVHVPSFQAVFDQLQIGGDGSVAAIYDEFGLSLDHDKGPPASFAQSAARRYGDDFLIAEGFESGLSKTLTTRGPASRGDFAFELKKGTTLTVADPLPLARPFVLEAYGSGQPGLRLESADGTLLLSVTKDGVLLDRDGRALGRIGLPVNGIRVRVGREGGNLVLTGTLGQPQQTGIEAARSIRPVLVATADLSLESLVIRRAN